MGDMVFISELKGARVRSAGGQELGVLDGIVADTGSGEMRYILLASPTADAGRLMTDPRGRGMLEFRDIGFEDGCVIVTVR